MDRFIVLNFSLMRPRPSSCASLLRVPVSLLTEVLPAVCKIQPGTRWFSSEGSWCRLCPTSALTRSPGKQLLRFPGVLSAAGYTFSP